MEFVPCGRPFGVGEGLTICTSKTLCYHCVEIRTLRSLITALETKIIQEGDIINELEAQKTPTPQSDNAITLTFTGNNSKRIREHMIFMLNL